MLALIFVATGGLFGVAGCVGAIRCGSNWGLIDRPSDRSSHFAPTPKGGGVGILLAFCSAAIVLKLKIGIWLPPALLSLVSLVGDSRDIRPKVRLLIQFGAAIAVLIAGSVPLPLLGATALVVVLMVGAIYIVGTANFYNFMDGINGVAGLCAILAYGFLAWFSASLGQADYLMLNICVASACIAFLPFNFPRAHVFMGDVGSILLGFVFAMEVVFLSRTLIDFMCLAAALLMFYMDEISTMAIRIWSGDAILKPHRKHLYQILVNEFGIAHYKVSSIYALAQLAICLVFGFLINFKMIYVIFAYGACFAVFCVVSLVIRNCAGTRAGERL